MPRRNARKAERTRVDAAISQQPPRAAHVLSAGGEEDEKEEDEEDISSLRNRFALLDLDEEGGATTAGAARDEGSGTDSEESSDEALPAERAAVPYDYFAVLDFECTCDLTGWTGHEIIEFPVVFLNALTLRVDLVFRRFVRPLEKPRLTKFCRELTGIEQADVDAAAPLQKVLAEFHEFLLEHELVSRRGDRSGARRLFTVCTDGHWDVKKFLRPESQRKRIRLESYWWTWVDLRAIACEALHRKHGNLQDLLRGFGLEFEGRPHSGIEDAKNLARLSAELLRRGVRLTPSDHNLRRIGSRLKA